MPGDTDDRQLGPYKLRGPRGSNGTRAYMVLWY